MIIAYYVGSGNRWIADDGRTFTDSFSDAAEYQTEELAQAVVDADREECALYVFALLS